jgi:hypothetical protein
MAAPATVGAAVAAAAASAAASVPAPAADATGFLQPPRYMRHARGEVEDDEFAQEVTGILLPQIARSASLQSPMTAAGFEPTPLTSPILAPTAETSAMPPSPFFAQRHLAQQVQQLQPALFMQPSQPHPQQVQQQSDFSVLVQQAGMAAESARRSLPQHSALVSPMPQQLDQHPSHQMAQLLKQQEMIQAQQHALFVEQQQHHLHMQMPHALQASHSLESHPMNVSAAASAAAYPAPHGALPDGGPATRSLSRKRSRKASAEGAELTAATSSTSSLHLPERPVSAAAAYRPHEVDSRIAHASAQQAFRAAGGAMLTDTPQRADQGAQDDSEAHDIKRCRSAEPSLHAAGRIYYHPSLAGLPSASSAAPMHSHAPSSSAPAAAASAAAAGTEDLGPLKRPQHRRRLTNELLPHEVWTCPYSHPDTNAPCGKSYRTSSSRSIQKHALNCKLRPLPGSAAARKLSSEKKQKKRRKSHELAPHERWNCPYGCGRFFRSTSTKSIQSHKITCPLKMQDGDTAASSAVQPRPDESNEAYRQRMQERQLAGLERARLKQQAAAGGGANSNAPAHFHSDASDSEHDGSDGSSSSSSSDEDEEGQAAAAASAKADDPAADFPASPIPSMPLTAPTLANSTTLNFAGAGIDSADTSGLPALPMQQLLQSPPQPPSQRLQQSMHPPGGGEDESGVSLNFPRRRSFGDGEMLPGDSASQSGMSNALASPSTADALMTISRGSSEIPGADLVFMPPQPLSQIMPMRTIQQSPHDKEMQSLFQQQMQTQHMQRQQSSPSQMPDGSMLSLPSAAPSPVLGAAAAAAAGALPSSLNSSALIDAAAGTARQIANIQAQLDLVQRMQSMEQRDNSAVGPAANNSGNGMLVDLQQSIEHAQQQLMQQQLRQERMRLQAQEQQRINALQQQQQQMQQPIPPPLRPYGAPPLNMPLSDDPNVLRMLLLQHQRENEILREQSHLLQVRLDQSASRPSSSASMRELANDMSNLQWAQHAHQPTGVANYAAPYPYAIGVNNLPAAAGLPMATGYIGGGAPPYRPDLLLQSPTNYAPLAVPSSSLVGAPVDPHASLSVKLVRPRRTGPQLPDHERWTCPLNGCNKFFKKSSSNSIRRHAAECLTANLTANTPNLPADAAAVIAAGMPRNSSRAAAAAQAARLAPLESPQQHHRTLSANGDDASSPLASAADESYTLDASEDDDGDDDR